MDNPMQKPQNADQQALPMQPVVAGSANQTNARAGMVSPELPAAAANDPAWAARVALNDKLNPSTGPAPQSQPQQGFFSRALPPNGAPTPTFAPPNPASDAKAGLAALLGITPEHSAQGQALVAGGQPPTPPPQVPGVIPTMPGPAPTHEQAQAILANSLAWADQVHPATGLPNGHPLHNPEQMSREQFIAANQGVPAWQIMQAWQARKIPSMQAQAQSIGAQGQPDRNAFMDYIIKLAQGQQAITDQGFNAAPGASGGMPPTQ